MKSNRFFLLLIVAVFLTSCEQEVDILNPKMFHYPELPYAFDKVEQELIVSVEVDGKDAIADSIVWEILDKNNQILSCQSISDKRIEWVPIAIGRYTVNCTVYAGKKSITEVDKVTIDQANPIKLYPLLSGSWEVTGRSDDAEWKADFEFGEYSNYGTTFTAQLSEVITGTVLNPLGYPATFLGNIEAYNYTLSSEALGSENLTGSFNFHVKLEDKTVTSSNGYTRKFHFTDGIDAFEFEVEYKYLHGVLVNPSTWIKYSCVRKP